MSPVKPVGDAKKSAATEPSSVKLTAFASFTVPKTGVDLKVAYGASRGVIAGEGEESRRYLEMGNVPFGRRGVKAPEGGLLMLYGFRDNIDELKDRRAAAREAKAEFHYGEVEAEVGVNGIVVGIIDRKALNGLRFANVKRMSADLQSDILSAFSSYVKEEGGREKEDMSKIRQIAQRPDLFCRLLDEDPDMKSMEVLVIPVADDPQYPARIRQVAYVRQGAHILNIDQNTEQNKFVLPQWMLVPRKTALKQATKSVASQPEASAPAPKPSKPSKPKIVA